mmetsp:Transcript_15658/g.32146  ORF Transcript_15658/g.32146 Transcript_15658/m.32146 type:complete len:97 (+) Transcript_15658:74-364(+)
MGLWVCVPVCTMRVCVVFVCAPQCTQRCSSSSGSAALILNSTGRQLWLFGYACTELNYLLKDQECGGMIHHGPRQFGAKTIPKSPWTSSGIDALGC